MTSLYCGKSCIVLTTCLVLYVILSSLLLFYVEECSVDKTNLKMDKEAAIIERTCKTVLADAYNANNTNRSADVLCKKIIAYAAFDKGRTPDCNFSPKKYLPWLHCVIFSLLTIGDSAQSPNSVGGKSLLLIVVIFGIFPVIRLFIHTGIILNGIVEKWILSFELKILNRSPRMIHMMSAKIIFLQVFAIVIYNLAAAQITSLRVYRTNWTYWDSVMFWFYSLTTTDSNLSTFVTEAEFYADGGWRIVCIDALMIVNMVQLSGFLCSVVKCAHKSACPAAATIRNALKTQNPEIYMNIKPLKSHL